MNKILIISLFMTLTFAWAAKEDDKAWNSWKIKFQKIESFADEERENIAYMNFKTNEQKIIMHNANPKRKFNLGFNEFSIYDEVTFATKYCGTKKPDNWTSPGNSRTENFDASFGKYSVGNVPSAVDYRNLYQPIQNQGACGSCWAFAVGSALENFVKIRDPNFARVISQSFLVDCDLTNSGCNGGWPFTALLFARDEAKNLAPDNQNYPYKYPRRGMRFKCRKITLNLIDLGIGNPINPDRRLTIDEMKALLANNKHIIVAIYASSMFQNYKSGIYEETSGCHTGEEDMVNHAVVIVGYNETEKYWIIRNSWGTSWGEDGYMRMAFGESGLCNIERYCLVVA